MKAYSPTTNTTYDSWEDLVAAESNGYVVVVMMLANPTGKRNRFYSRVIGPYDTKREAKNRAARVRRQWNRNQKDSFDRAPEGYRLLSVCVEPAWKELS